MSLNKPGNLQPVIFYQKPLANEDILLRTHCCRHKCFPVCPRAQHLLRTQILCPGHKKCFWFCSETFCVRNKCFPVCAAQETSWATMCPQQCVLVCQYLKIKFSIVWYWLIIYESNINYCCHFRLENNIMELLSQLRRNCEFEGVVLSLLNSIGALLKNVKVISLNAFLVCSEICAINLPFLN